MPDPCIIVRLLLVRQVGGAPEFFCIPTARGLDLPTLYLASGSTVTSSIAGLARLAKQIHGRTDVEHRCVGYVRNVVPDPDPTYPHPGPWAHVPVFRPVETVEPICDGTWLSPSSALSELTERHWWPIVEHHLSAETPR